MGDYPASATALSIVIIGGGTAGTIVANMLRRRAGAARIIVVDRDDDHLYQPGLLFVPFAKYRRHELTKPRRRQFARGINLRFGEVERIDPERRTVDIRGGEALSYDVLVIASGTAPRPDRTPGMLGQEWRRRIFDFYTLHGALSLRGALRRWRGGRLVVHIVDMPIKCPVAPLEFCFLVAAFLVKRGLRDSTEITFVTPLDAAFTRPVAAAHLGELLSRRGIRVDTDFVTDFIDDKTRELVSMDERRVRFDLLVTVPLNMGADFVAISGIGDELNYVPVGRHTLAAQGWPDIFVIGDASDAPASKAGSTAHFAAHTVVHNVFARVADRQLVGDFDGHANCFVETGRGRGLLLDFNYDVEPLTRRFPIPVVGPFRLLAESRVNHLGKLAIICSKGSLDMAYPGLMLANAALGEGVETHLFFTFWGFDMITVSRMRDLAISPVGNTSMHLPGQDTRFPQALAPLPGMAALATRMMKKSLAKLETPEVPEFLDQIVVAGGHLWACRMSADMNGLTAEDLRNDVEGVISASDFIEKTAGAQLLFI